MSLRDSGHREARESGSYLKRYPRQELLTPAAKAAQFLLNFAAQLKLCRSEKITKKLKGAHFASPFIFRFSLKAMLSLFLFGFLLCWHFYSPFHSSWNVLQRCSVAIKQCIEALKNEVKRKMHAASLSEVRLNIIFFEEKLSPRVLGSQNAVEVHRS
jgi:hypothetical protein